MTQPYTYLIGWSNHNKWYYGVRYRRGCSPSDLWVTYFTSSKHVQRARTELGEPDIVQVRKVFEKSDAARLSEHRVLRRMRVRIDPRFLNRHDAPAFPSEKHPDHVALIAERLRGKKRTAEQKARMCGSKGKTWSLSEQTKQRQSEAKIGKKFSEEHRQNIAKAMTGQEQSAETRAKRKASLTGKKKSPEHVRAVVEAKKRRAAERALLG